MAKVCFYYDDSYFDRMAGIKEAGFMRNVGRCLGLAIGLLIVAGCGGGIGVRKSDFAEQNQVYNRVSIDGERLGGATQNFLNAHFWRQQFADDPDAVIQATEQLFRRNHDRRYLEYLIDMCRYSADKGKSSDSIKYYPASCLFSYLYLFDPAVTPDAPRFAPGYFLAVCYYNEALTEIFKYLQKNKLQFCDSYSLPMVIGGRLHFAPPYYELPLDLSDYSDFLLCSDYLPVNFLTYTHSPGIGVPLITVSAKGNDKYELKVMPGQTYASTAILRFDSTGEFYRARLEYFDTTRTEAVTVNNLTAPLQLDYSTPWAYMLKDPPEVSDVFYFLNPYQGKQIEGLYCMTPFQRNKIPVVFVHGLLSNPRTWAQMINTLMGDPVIRKNYQFWFFAYATGNPIIYSAALLRQTLEKVNKKIDPGFRNDKFDKMVIVAHSMGGLLSKTLIQNSGDAFFSPTATNGHGRKILDDLSSEQRNFVLNMFVFSCQPYVKRVIFLATPHQGSDLATWKIIRLYSRWVTLPHFLEDNIKKIMVRTKLKKPDDDIYVNTGLDNLSPDDYILKKLQQIPFQPGIPYHSIIGNEDQAGCPGGSDGVVPYSSAHLDGAWSELVVKSGHSVQTNAAAIEEIRRLLHAHLQENGLINKKTDNRTLLPVSKPQAKTK